MYEYTNLASISGHDYKRGGRELDINPLPVSCPSLEAGDVILIEYGDEALVRVWRKTQRILSLVWDPILHQPEKMSGRVAI